MTNSMTSNSTNIRFAIYTRYSPRQEWWLVRTYQSEADAIRCVDANRQSLLTLSDQEWRYGPVEAGCNNS
jgi:hypothetical protein